MQPWGANRWWPAGADARCSQRSCWPSRPGSRLDATSAPGCCPSARARGRPTRYAAPLGLGLRLQRGPIIGWTLDVVLTALLFGSVVEAMTDLIADAGGSAGLP